MVCDTRQLTQAERTAALNQQSTGVMRAIRPFTGSPTLPNLIDYMNRELVPAIRQSRSAVNDIYNQVADNAPSANPLSFYFSASTANADPTAGFIRLDNATENAATTMRVSQTNGRLEDVTPWLEVMAGGATSPLGVVTLIDAINPGRFIRANLSTMTDVGAYWNLGITVVESSDTNPFVDGEGVVVSFIPGVATTGAKVPVGSLSPIANNTFIGNISGGTAAPAADNLSSLASTSIVFDAASHTYQSAATTGDVTSTQNSNARTIANGAVTNAKLANMNPGTVKGLNIDASAAGAPIDLTGAQVGELTRFAFFADGAGSAGTNNDFALDQRTSIIRINPNSLGGDVTITGFALGAGGSTGNNGGRIILVKQGSSNLITLNHEDAGSVGNNRLELPGGRAYTMSALSETIELQYLGGRWQLVGATIFAVGTGLTMSTAKSLSIDQSFSPTWTNTHNFNAPLISNNEILINDELLINGVISPSIGANQNNWNPTGLATCSVMRVTTTAAGVSISGLTAQSAGTVILVFNVGSNSFLLNGDSASSSAANRFSFSGASISMAPNSGLILWYDGTSSRWRGASQV